MPHRSAISSQGAGVPDRVHASEEKLAEALHGTVTDHHRFLLRQHLQIIEMLEGSLREFDHQIDEMLSPFREAAGN